MSNDIQAAVPLVYITVFTSIAILGHVTAIIDFHVIFILVFVLVINAARPSGLCIHCNDDVLSCR